MRNHLDLPDDLPRPFGSSVYASTSAPTTKPARCVAQGVWEDPYTGRWSCYVRPPACSPHVNVEMRLRDQFGGDETAVQEVLDRMARCAEDEAIQQLDVETQDALVRFKVTLIQGEVGSVDRFRIHLGSVDRVSYSEFKAADVWRLVEAHREKYLGRMHIACDPGAPGGDQTTVFASTPGSDKTVAAMLAVMQDADRQMRRAMGIVPQDPLTWD